MKYKRISTKDYLVNEDQFIDLLENKALEGWYLKNISLNFLTFEKRTPQRKHYKIYYKQINKDIKEAGCRIIVNYFGLQVVEVEDLFAQPLKQDVGDKKEILSTNYNFTTHYFLMIIGIVLLIAVCINTFADTMLSANKQIRAISSLLTSNYIGYIYPSKIPLQKYSMYYGNFLLTSFIAEISIIYDISHYNPQIKEYLYPQLSNIAKLLENKKLQIWLNDSLILKMVIQLKSLLPDDHEFYVEIPCDKEPESTLALASNQEEEFWNNYICTIGRINLDKKIEVLENYLNGDETRPQEAMIEMIITSWNAAATLQFMFDPTLASFADAKEFEFFVDFLKNEWPTLPEELKSRFYEEPLINAWLDAWQKRINALKE